MLKLCWYQAYLTNLCVYTNSYHYWWAPKASLMVGSYSAWQQRQLRVVLVCPSFCLSLPFSPLHFLDDRTTQCWPRSCRVHATARAWDRRRRLEIACRPARCATTSALVSYSHRCRSCVHFDFSCSYHVFSRRSWKTAFFALYFRINPFFLLNLTNKTLVIIISDSSWFQADEHLSLLL